jgi:DNA-binding CsgD family transcriptional regulator
LEDSVVRREDTSGRRNQTSSGDHVAADDDRPLTAAVQFLEEGLRFGEPAIVIATERQSWAIQNRLAVRFDVEHLRRVGDLAVIDAQSLYDNIFVGDVPDAGRFTHDIGDAIERALHGRVATVARVYDGVVEWLWKRGKVDAAARLETMFYALGRTHAFSLLCAYAMRDFYKQTGPWHELESRDPQIEWDPPPADATGLPERSPITKREQDVLRRTALGHANKDIANALNISVRTVEAHKANAMRKLGLTERAEVIRFAVSNGWLAMVNEPPR